MEIHICPEAPRELHRQRQRLELAPATAAAFKAFSAAHAHSNLALDTKNRVSAMNANKARAT